MTPPDVFSMLSLAFPMYLLYEVSIWIAKLIEKKREEADAQAEAELDAELRRARCAGRRGGRGCTDGRRDRLQSDAIHPLPDGERGRSAKRWEGEGRTTRSRSFSRYRPRLSPHPLPVGRGLPVDSRLRSPV